jgi:hypothetical protein
MRKRLRYADLKAFGVVTNRVTLGNWIRDRGFPPGQLTGPNSRTWSEAEVQLWLERRPTKSKPAPAVTKPESEWKGRRGRPRKSRAESPHAST